jgi:hypothetical protein
VEGGKFEGARSLDKPPDVLRTAVAALIAWHGLDGNRISQYMGEMIGRHPLLGEKSSYQGAEHDRLFEAAYDHQGGDDCSRCDPGQLLPRAPRSTSHPVIHYGLIASANQVMRDARTRDRLRDEHDVLCFEMEAAGLLDHFPCLVIRGICDYADSHKNKRWQEYAALTAAAYAKELLGIISID